MDPSTHTCCSTCGKAIAFDPSELEIIHDPAGYDRPVCLDCFGAYAHSIAPQALLFARNNTYITQAKANNPSWPSTYH